MCKRLSSSSLMSMGIDVAPLAILACWALPLTAGFDVCSRGQPTALGRLLATSLVAILQSPLTANSWLVVRRPGSFVHERLFWTCNGFAPVTYLIMPPLPQRRAG